MNVWERVTGSDLTREYRGFEARAAVLPPDHRAAWEEIKADLAPLSSFTGRNHQGVLDLVGDDVAAFCDDLVKDTPTYADAYQESITRELGTGKE